MSIILDTSSLLALVRYYLPFDINGQLRKFIEHQINSGEFLIIDKVVNEAGSVAKGIILTEFAFIKPKAISTISTLPNQKFFNLLDNQFCNQAIKRLSNLTNVEYSLERSDFLEKADAKMMLYALSIKIKKPLIVTEETVISNDKKLFKKIPACCREIDIPTCNLPELFKTHLGHSIVHYLK